ncbi:flagellar biosynthesis anti-sigma factor FlgM [Paraglaciecola psychrophila]|uniref:Negative regulator of flagellin synthesis n=1 Tax=Paraglaciecola psychrophila 170 TaxID=1129794 RepID=K6ZNM3_9ALTE|nr:flagellar biosynthesis anti-sigma factor FlgM [Paraglaciecola psychrophila]AGH45827.1 negative regulator of flagellin synthesis FlgM [Paraglaciecola psychrophila 170]GAC37551.1 negative regulator of flagellin synthesis FlgM [Paraglaciecola psychrophila 170]
MSINNINNGSPKAPVDNQRLSQQQQALNNGNAQQSSVQQAATAGVRQDSVSLTTYAQQLSQVQRKSTEAPVNQEKVDRLKKEIQSGDYQVNPESLAQKISTLESELFGTKA